MIVEDGTGISNANSYASASYADTYFSDRGIVGWSGTTLAKEQWLIQGTDYLESKSYVGRRIYPDVQALAFPRECLYADGRTLDGLPENIKKAVCEVALAIKEDRLYGDSCANTNSSGLIKRIRKKAGTMETETEYVDGVEYFRGAVFLPVVDALLSPFIAPKFGGTYR